MKILFCITKGNFGGAQRYVYDLATSAPKDQFESIVALGEEEELEQKLAEKSIRTIKIDGLGREIDASKDWRVFKNLIKIIKEEKPNILHFNSSKIGFLGSLAILYLRIINLITHYSLPVTVFTSHGWAFNEKNKPLISRIIYYIAHYFTVIICDKTIAVSEKTKRDISWLPFIAHKIEVIHNGIGDFPILERDEARKFLLQEKNVDKTILLSLSELHPNKGLDVALNALAKLPEESKNKIIYCIAGSGEEKENLSQLTKNLGLENIVIFLGFIPEARKYLSGADIFLMPSRTENLPYAILEAGSAGLPIIASSVGGIPEIIDDMGSGVLVHPQNAKELSLAIIYLLEHPEKKEEFGKTIKEKVNRDFGQQKMIDKTLQTYDFIIH